MKVLDEHILEYIWDETLDRIAQRTLVTYIGVPYGMDDTGRACKTLPINALPGSIFELKTNCYRILRSQYPTY